MTVRKNDFFFTFVVSCGRNSELHLSLVSDRGTMNTFCKGILNYIQFLQFQENVMCKNILLRI